MVSRSVGVWCGGECVIGLQKVSLHRKSCEKIEGGVKENDMFGKLPRAPSGGVP